MPRMKWGADFDELPEDWDESDFTEYDGPVPPSKKLLKGEAKKMWAATSSSGNEMLVVLFEASGNKGENEKYNGWSTFERIPLIPKMNWKYGPLLEALGVTLDDVKRKTLVAEEDDNVGTPIKKIGAMKLPKAMAVITKREKYEDETRAIAGKFASAVTKKSRSRRAADEDEDEYEDDDVPF
jgi:hypothetical protein